jgi:hypothetical protein
MKTKYKQLVVLFLLASITLNHNNGLAQGCFSNLVSPPNRTEVQSVNAILNFSLEPSVNPCNTSAGTSLTGVGFNQKNPQYMVDILCDTTVPTNSDVNVSTTKKYLKNVGYRIGGNMVMWTNCDTPSPVHKIEFHEKTEKTPSV